MHEKDQTTSWTAHWYAQGTTVHGLINYCPPVYLFSRQNSGKILVFIVGENPIRTPHYSRISVNIVRTVDEKLNTDSVILFYIGLRKFICMKTNYLASSETEKSRLSLKNSYILHGCDHVTHEKLCCQKSKFPHVIRWIIGKNYSNWWKECDLHKY